MKFKKKTLLLPFSERDHSASPPWENSLATPPLQPPPWLQVTSTLLRTFRCTNLNASSMYMCVPWSEAVFSLHCQCLTHSTRLITTAMSARHDTGSARVCTEPFSPSPPQAGSWSSLAFVLTAYVTDFAGGESPPQSVACSSEFRVSVQCVASVF